MIMIVGNVCALHARVRVTSLHCLTPKATYDKLRFHTLRLSSLRRRHNRRHNQYSPKYFASLNNGGSGDDAEEWIPPDHSPLAANKLHLAERSSSFKQADSERRNKIPDSREALIEDEIKVVDLEATLNNPKNQQLLQEFSKDSEKLSPGAEFDIRPNDVSWKEVLKEMREAGETDMVDSVVKEYGLESLLSTLEDDIDMEGSDSSVSSEAKKKTSNDQEEWDEEFELSLQGLSQEDLIDELIENSPSLTELEMEIISQEMDRFEKGERGGLDYDLLEESEWNENAAYKDFRAMVLDDYYAKKRSRTKGPILIEGNVVKEVTGKINSSAESDFVDYPQDWKDYDSNAAFQRDFSREDDSWVPPSSEFVPSHSYDTEEKPVCSSRDYSKLTNTSRDDFDSTIDWLWARRSRLGYSSEEEQLDQKPTHMLTPLEAQTFHHLNSQIQTIPYTLLTTSEISSSLTVQGGTDLRIIDTTEFSSVYGAGIGCRFIMVVTGRNPSHIRVLADSLVRNLKARKLNERGVVGAIQGAEGGQDIFSTKQSRNRTSRRWGVSTSGKVDDDWIVVDCENIHVHILEDTTRKCLNIEGLWDFSNPESEGSKLRRVDFSDDDTIDTYIAENPIPEEYAAKLLNQAEGGRVRGYTHVVSAFQRKSFSEKWRGVSKAKRKKKRR